jgi:hypothetical protein
MKPKCNLPELTDDQIRENKMLLNEVEGFKGLKMPDDARLSLRRIADRNNGVWKMISSFDVAVSEGKIKDALNIAGDLTEKHPNEPWGAILYSQLVLLRGQPLQGYSMLERYKKTHDSDAMYCHQRCLLAALAGMDEVAGYYVARLVEMGAKDLLIRLKKRLDCYKQPPEQL